MKKCLFFIFALALLVFGSGPLDAATPQGHSQGQGAGTEFFRSREFHDKYRLTEVVVFSRHNIRAPLAAPGSFISKVTPYEWHDFGVKASELTDKGGVLETINGQFFRRWLLSEGLFKENEEPSEGEIFVFANSKQRTIATAKYFLAGFMPTVTIPVNHCGKINDMNPVFSLTPGNDITDEQWRQIKAEYDAEYDAEGIRKASLALQPGYDLLEKILKLKESPAYKNGSFTGFNNHNSEIIFPEGDEPRMTASINDACSIADALILQYYEEPDLNKVAFGRNLSREEWQSLSRIIETRDAIRFHSPFVQHYVSQRQRDLIAGNLLTPGRKFAFICGHDVNIFNILNSMRVKHYGIPDAIEVSTPIGSKIVFEKWVDAEGNAFIGVNHIYQTAGQLRGNVPLDMKTTPGCIRLQFEGLEANEDGLYPLDILIRRLTEKAVPGITPAPC